MIGWARAILLCILSLLLTCVLLFAASWALKPGYLTDILESAHAQSMEARLSKLEGKLQSLQAVPSSATPDARLEARLLKDENQIDAVESSSKNLLSSDQQKNLIDELRKELAEARSQTERTEHATSTFFVLYALITGVLVSDGLLSKNRLEKQATESTQKLKEATEKVVGSEKEVEEHLTKRVDLLEGRLTLANDQATIKAVNAAERAESAKEDLVKRFEHFEEQSKQFENFITTRRRALFEEVPKFVDQHVEELSLDHTTFRDPAEQATLDEIDHLTFLSASFRFREPDTPEERDKYLKALIAISRLQILKSLPGAALNRIDKFFEFDDREDKSPKANRRRAQAFAIRARAYYLLFKSRTAFAASSMAPDPSLRDGLREYRARIEEYVELGRQADFSWGLTHQYYAIYLSLLPVKEDVPEAQKKDSALRNQQAAIAIYQMLIDRHGDFTPNTGRTSRRNACCCHKRVGDLTGDYSGLFDCLSSLPKESEILHNRQFCPPAHPDLHCQFLWHEMISDETFFERLKWPEQCGEYQKKWGFLVREKMDVSDVVQVYRDLSERLPASKEWAVKPWLEL